MSSEFKLQRNVVTAVFAFAANLILVFVSYRLVIAQGGLEKLGVWSTLTAWIFMIRLGDVGMAAATTRFVAACELPQDVTRIKTYVDTGLVMNGLLFSVLAIIGALLLMGQLPNILPASEQEEAASIVPIMILSFFLMNMAGLITGGLQGLHLGYRAAWLGVFGTLMQLLVAVITVPAHGLWGLAVAQAVQYALVVAGGWALILKAMGDGLRLPRRVSKEVFREMLGFSVRAQFANLLNGLFEPVAKILIGQMAGLGVLGRFELAYKIVSLPRSAVVAGVYASVPAITRLMKSDKEQARVLYQRSVLLVSKSASGVLSLVFLLTPPISWLWLGEIDNQLWAFVGLLAFGFLVNTVGAPAYTLGIASGRLAGNIQSAILSLLSMVFVSINAYYAVGVYGLVFGVFIGLAIGGVFIRRKNEQLIYGK